MRVFRVRLRMRSSEEQHERSECCECELGLTLRSKVSQSEGDDMNERTLRSKVSVR